MGVKKVGKYEIGKTIGEGTFGKVKSAINTETGEQVALKVLDKSAIQKQNMGPQIKKEISIMKMVSHPHVVRLIEVLASRTKIFIVLEMVTGGELFDKIVAEGRFSEDKARFYFRQLLAGVEYCHARGVCHRDLKPENLLLDENGNLKISDFGLSALYSGGTDEGMKLLHTTCGTPNYVAPEVLADQGYDGRKADLWSCGVILYVLLAGFLPFDENSMSALFKKIQAADFSYPRWFSQEVRGLLDRIMTVDVNKRLTIPQMKEDPWITLNGTLAWPEVDPHGSGGGGGGGGGVNKWAAPSSRQDGMLDVVAVYGAFHLGQLQMGLASAEKVGQCRAVRLATNDALPMQVDGEPWVQEKCVIRIQAQPDKIPMLMFTKEGGEVVEDVQYALDNALAQNFINSTQHGSIMAEISNRIEQRHLRASVQPWTFNI